MWCIVNLPNGTQIAVTCDSKAFGQECLEKVCKALNIICEMEYFGLEHWTPNQLETRTHQWVNLRNRLGHDSGASSGIQLMLALRVKFWVPCHLILQESSRNLFYMQAKQDLLEGRLMPKTWESSAKLSAFLCQADGIRFNKATLTAKYPLHKKQQEQQKEKKEKEPVLAFKKRRLSKQKSMENFEFNNHSHPTLVHQRHSLESSTIIFDNKTNNELSTDFIDDDEITASPLSIYEDYVIRPSIETEMPDDCLKQIAIEHDKLNKLKMSSKSAKYWLLKEIQELPAYGEEVFNGVTTNENSSVRCDVAVGANGITVYSGDEKYCIPFSAIAAAKSFRKVFKLEYISNDHNERKDLEVKFPKHCIAAALYRSITEKHAFYVCDKVRGVVTSQFTRDLKGTIASMFKEDTELGKRYVFDIQRTCREVHDRARRILFEGSRLNDDFEKHPSNTMQVDDAIKEKEEHESVIQKCVDSRISEAMKCKLCYEHEIDTIFNCGHAAFCRTCALKCDRCPNCRVRITSVSKIYLPTELRRESCDSDENKNDAGASTSSKSNLASSKVSLAA